MTATGDWLDDLSEDWPSNPPSDVGSLPAPAEESSQSETGSIAITSSVVAHSRIPRWNNRQRSASVVCRDRPSGLQSVPESKGDYGTLSERSLSEINILPETVPHRLKKYESSDEPR